MLLPHLPRDFVALRSCLQIPQLLTLADVRFLRRATQSRLGRIPLQPWVEETTESTVEDRMRHNYQTEWSVHWECAAGPLQGALTLKQQVWLIRNHEKALHAYHVYLYELAQKVVTCNRCNRRQVQHAAGQECKTCMNGAMFAPENGMSLGPRMQDEASLAAQVQRAALFSAFAKATDMEKSLVRAVTPVVSVTRLVYSGHGQFSYRGHAIGLTNNGLQVALNLPRSPSENGLHVICDPGENYRTDPGLSRILYARRALVEFLVKALIVQNSAYNSVYGSLYEPPEASLGAIPEGGIPEGISVVYEDREAQPPSTNGAFSVNTSVLAKWILAGESDPEDFPIAARTYGVLKDTYNFELDIFKLAQDIQGNSRAAPLQEMTRVSQLVTFLLKFGDAILQCDTSGLPTRPPPAGPPPPKKETKAQREARKRIEAAAEASLKPWDVIDSPILTEMENLRFLHAGDSISDSSKPSGFVKRRSEHEQQEANLKQLAEEAGFTKTKSPPPSAAVLPRRGAAVSEKSPGLFALMYPDVFPMGSGDLNAERGVKVPPRKHLEWVIFQDTSAFFQQGGWDPSAGSPQPPASTSASPAAVLLHHLGLGTACRFTMHTTGKRMKLEGTASGARFQRYRDAATLRQALSTTTVDAQWRGSTVGGATKEDLVYDFTHGLLLIGANPGEVVASAAGINGCLPAQASRTFTAHCVNVFARHEAMVQSTLFLREQLPRFFQAADLKKLLQDDKSSKSSEVPYRNGPALSCALTVSHYPLLRFV